jgi:hypothetical protein
MSILYVLEHIKIQNLLTFSGKQEDALEKTADTMYKLFTGINILPI